MRRESHLPNSLPMREQTMSRQRGIAVAGLLAACLLVGGCRHVPHSAAPTAGERMLFSFERRTMMPMYSGSAPRAIVPQHATHGKHALRLKLSPGRETIILDTGGFPMDWRGWQRLKVDIYREGAPIKMNLRVSDRHGKRHWVWGVPLSTGASTLTYEISPLSEKIDLSVVSELMWYAEDPSGEIYLDAVRLSRS
jgi:hypothetical protein